jgi:glycosyltransferase involved in cell wall biosynthesis
MPIDPAKLRVAVFSGNYNYCADGVALVLNRLVAYLLTRGVQVEVFAPTSKTPALQHAGTLISVPSVTFPLNSNYRVAWGIPKRVRRRIKDFAPHLFHLASPDALGFAALRTARRLGIPAVATYHTHFGEYMKYFGLGFLEPLTWRVMRRFYNRTCETYVPSPSMRDLLRGKGFTCPMEVWEHGVDTAKFNPARRSLAWRRSHGIQDNDILVGFVGRVVWEKAVAVWGDVIQKLEQSGRSIKSVMIGSGPALESMKSRLKNTLFPGYMPHETLATAFASMDVFLYPSVSETFGCVTLEAMASGVPPVAANATGSRDIITDGIDGFLCAPGNVDDLANQVLHLADESALRERLRNAGVQHAAGCTWEKVLGEMVEHYQKIVSA